MAVDRVRLLNTTDQVLRLRYNGKAIVFQPHGTQGSVQALPAAAASYVQGHVGNAVQVLAQEAAVSYVEHKTVERFYLANFSGDPDSPAEYESKYITKDGNEASRKVRNEIHTPQVFKARLGRESKMVDAGAHMYIDPFSGKPERNKRPMQVTYPGKMLVIPPYTVVEVTAGQFQTLLNMEQDKPSEYPRFLRASRPPAAFEPDFNNPWWTLDRCRAFLEMFEETNEREAGAAVIGQSEKEMRDELAAADVDEDSIELLIEEERYKMFARCKIRCMDLAHVVPTKAEYDAHWARRAKAAKADERAKTT